MNQFQLEPDVILTFLHVFSSIVLTVFTVSMFRFTRRQKLKEQQVLLQVVGAKSPSSFEILCEKEKVDANDPICLENTKKILAILSSDREKIFKKAAIREADFEQRVFEMESVGSIKLKQKQVHIESTLREKVTKISELEKGLFDKLPKDYTGFEGKQAVDLRNNAGYIYYQPKTLKEDSIAEESLMFNLIERMDTDEECKNGDKRPRKGICVCKDLTEIQFKNFGAPLMWLKIEHCTITYLDGKNDVKIKKLKSKNEDSLFSLSFDNEGIARLKISEATEDQKNALCDVSQIDPTKHVTEIRYEDDFLNYERIEIDMIAKSSSGEECKLTFLMEKTGDMLSANINKRKLPFRKKGK